MSVSSYDVDASFHLTSPPPGTITRFTVTLNFLMIAGALFLAVKGMNKLKKEQRPAPNPELTPEVKLLTEIRDLLRGRGAACQQQTEGGGGATNLGMDRKHN